MHKPLQEYKPLEGNEFRCVAGDAASLRIRWTVAAILALGCVLGLFSVLRSGRPSRVDDADLLGVTSEAEANSAVEASWIVMRHCARGMPSGGVKALEDGVFKYTSVDAYSTRPFPNFPGVTPHSQECLPRGADIVEAQGRFFGSHGDMPLPVNVSADAVSRDQVTMTRFLQGLQLRPEQCTTKSSHGLFVQSSLDPACKRMKPGKAAMISNAQAHLRANPAPAEYPTYLRTLFKIMGNGSAGNWTDLGCSIFYNGAFTYPVGACQVAAELTEYLLMEWGGGLEIAWGRLNADDLLNLLVLHSWWFFQWWGPSDVYRFFGAPLARELSARATERATGTHLYVGHDSNIMMLKGALGLRWEPVPFPANATLPGSMLRFDRTKDVVTASYWYLATFSDVSGTMLRVPAIFSSTSSNRIAIQMFKTLLDAGSVASCALN